MQSVFICVTDSRGRGLKRHLEESRTIPGKTVVVERCIGGATLQQIFAAIREAKKLDKKYPTQNSIHSHRRNLQPNKKEPEKVP